ncbi:DMT family transporter [Cohaesibacter haloalkalitolerans]|uniref:DMT family transporter n=1 Tax=Cohaesibacter haloalkalitolerans TaxID=1162980 RepID=UPI000E6535DE|nr:DMT family transporter [Cohaesibacter haloalkalitolerans]
MFSRSANLLSRLAPLLFVVLWSTGFVGSRMGAPYSEPLTFLSMRFGAVLALLLAITFIQKVRWPNPRQSAHAFVSGFMIHGLYLTGVFWAIDDGMPAGLFALMTGLQPVLTAFFAHLLLSERITRNHVIGFVLGLVGICMVLLPRLSGGTFSVTPIQILVSLVAVISISFGTVYQKRFAANLDMRTATIWQYCAALLFCGGLSLFTETQTIIWSPDFIFALVWLVLVLSIGAIFLLLWLIEKGAVSNTASLFYLVPAVTATISYLLFGEPITLLQVLGMIVTALGVILASRRKA